MQKLTSLFPILLSFFILNSCHHPSPNAQQEGTINSKLGYIQPSTDFPAYWQYKGEPLLLLGGSVEDNLFQYPDLEKHLELLQSVGGNYVRNTMSSRDSGNVWPFHLSAEGKYDLNQWNEEYWHRLSNFLEETSQREIIVQLEVWATFDFYRENWNVNPFNPKNNKNYSEGATHLPTEVSTHPTFVENNFFWSVPAQESNLRLLGYQQKFVDKLLSISLKFDHVLYCMDNETSVTSEWGKFWSLYMKKVASENGKKIFTTEMWDPWDLSHVAHRETIDHPEIYDFADISQNNHNTGEKHWEIGMKQLQKIKNSGKVRPANNVKIYGNDGGRHQTTKNAIESFCRNVFMGTASARFHRPTSGQGLNETARAVIKSMRLLTDKMDFFNGRPITEILEDRSENEAYVRGIPGKEYAIYFTNGGEVKIDLSNFEGEFTLIWLDISTSEWSPESKISGGRKTTLECPGKGNWVALILK